MNLGSPLAKKRGKVRSATTPIQAFLKCTDAASTQAAGTLVDNAADMHSSHHICLHGGRNHNRPRPHPQQLNIQRDTTMMPNTYSLLDQDTVRICIQGSPLPCPLISFIIKSASIYSSASCLPTLSRLLASQRQCRRPEFHIPPLQTPY